MLELVGFRRPLRFHDHHLLHHYGVLAETECQQNIDLDESFGDK